MKENDVPQDGMDYRNHNEARKLMYAVKQDGSYTGVNYAGWEPENLALRQAWEDVEERLEETEQAVKAGKLSPIAYHMERCLMTPSLLAGYMGLWTFTVKRHLKPRVFSKLKPSTMERYAAVFGIDVLELKSFEK